MLTYQDFLSRDVPVKDFIRMAINDHMSSDIYKIAILADKYDRQQNETIYNYTRMIMSSTGNLIRDITAANNRLASNFFHRLNVQRCTYSLGNGCSFTKKDTKEKLGADFDTMIKKIGYKALTHGLAFGYWNTDGLHLFPVTEFVPLWDEDTGAIRAGIRWWQLDERKPVTAVLYEEDGLTKYHSAPGTSGMDFVEVEPKRAYKLIYSVSEASGAEIIGEENYTFLPIVPMWGSSLHQSTLVGMQRQIDSYDLIQSGFANDLTDCAQIYWIISNAMGMDDNSLAQFRDRLLIQHIAVADTDTSDIKPYQQEIPHNARSAYLDMIRSRIYEDFGAVDVHAINAASTNDHIDAAYQPLDENADDFEFEVITFVHQLLSLIGIEDTPIFKRNRISNQKEQTEMVATMAEYLDDKTILKKLPWIDIDEVDSILHNRDLENQNRFDGEHKTDKTDKTEEDDTQV